MCLFSMWLLSNASKERWQEGREGDLRGRESARRSRHGKATVIILVTMTSPLATQQFIFKVMGGQNNRYMALCFMKNSCYSITPILFCVYSEKYLQHTNVDLNVFGNCLFTNVSTEVKENKKMIYFLSHLLKEVGTHFYTEFLFNGSLNPFCIFKAFHNSGSCQ